MKITLDIQDGKLAFFLELIRNFNFVRVVKDDAELGLSPAHRTILDERLSSMSAKKTELLDWEDVKYELEKLK